MVKFSNPIIRFVISTHKIKPNSYMALSFIILLSLSCLFLTVYTAIESANVTEVRVRYDEL